MRRCAGKSDFSHFNPRSPHGERRAPARQTTDPDLISIHAPRTGSDPRHGDGARVPRHISIHAPRTGSDALRRASSARSRSFQSTLPARGATRLSFSSTIIFKHFNPRSPHGERRIQRQINAHIAIISIHAPRTGSDSETSQAVVCRSISIHAPRTGSDIRLARACNISALFQSTLPARGATLQLNFYGQQAYISIHAPRTGSDDMLEEYSSAYQTFQSTLPARGATMTISSSWLVM